MNTFDAWVIETMTICVEIMTEEDVSAVDDIDDKVLGGMLISGEAEKITPNEMALRIQAVVDK